MEDLQPLLDKAFRREPSLAEFIDEPSRTLEERRKLIEKMIFEVLEATEKTKPVIDEDERTPTAPWTV